MSITLLNQTECDKLIDRVTSSSQSLTSDIHIAACSTLDHIREHHNYTGALKLLNGLSNGVRVRAVAAWYKGFSNGKFSPGLNPKTKQWQADLAKDRTENDFDMEGAQSVTFAEFTVEKDPTTLSLEKFIKGLKRTATNTGNFPGTAVPKVSAETRAVALKIVQFVQSEMKAGLTQ